MTALSTHIDSVRDRAREYDPRRAALTLVALLPFVVGWLVGMLAQTVWVAVAWMWAASVEGFTTARSQIGSGG